MRAQGALEYVLLVGGIIAIVVLAYTILTGMGGQANKMLYERLEEYGEGVSVKAAPVMSLEDDLSLESTMGLGITESSVE